MTIEGGNEESLDAPFRVIYWEPEKEKLLVPSGNLMLQIWFMDVTPFVAMSPLGHSLENGVGSHTPVISFIGSASKE